MFDFILFLLAAMQFAAIARVGAARMDALLEREEADSSTGEENAWHEPEMAGDPM